MTPEESSSSPIADLSYRGYDGPLYTRTFRWWVISLASIRLALKIRGFWVLLVLSSLPYFFAGVALYIRSQAPLEGPGPFFNAPSGQKYAGAFFQSYQMQSFWLLLLALLLGAGSIAADNRTNALMIYLSKPLTQGDYLLGKWVGIFLPLFVIALGPAALLYVYCFLSFSSQGFFREEPWLFLRVLSASLVPALLHSSLILPASAWFRSPRMAGGIYAGLYFISHILSDAYWRVQYQGNPEQGLLVQHLSIGGLIRGLGQNIYGVTLRKMVGHWEWGNLRPVEVPPPDGKILFLLAGCLILLGFFLARARIRAVEIVRG